MSCWICQEKTINRILSNKEFDNLTVEDKTKLGQKMVNMNYDAYVERYGTKEVQSAFPYTYKFQFVLTTLLQSLKSLKCFLYQCSEGNIDKRKLYKKLFDIEVLMMNRIINDLEEYDKVERG